MHRPTRPHQHAALGALEQRNYEGDRAQVPRLDAAERLEANALERAARTGLDFRVVVQEELQQRRHGARVQDVVDVRAVVAHVQHHVRGLARHVAARRTERVDDGRHPQLPDGAAVIVLPEEDLEHLQHRQQQPLLGLLHRTLPHQPHQARHIRRTTLLALPLVPVLPAPPTVARLAPFDEGEEQRPQVVRRRGKPLAHVGGVPEERVERLERHCGRGRDGPQRDVFTTIFSNRRAIDTRKLFF